MINDTNNNPITSASMTIARPGVKAFQLNLECRAGYRLTAATPDPEIEIRAKGAPGDSFTDIVAGDIDLTPFAPTIRTFFFEIEAGAGTEVGTQLAQIHVSR